MQALKQRIVELIKQIPESQNKIAASIGVTGSTITRFINGEGKVSMRMYLYVLDKFPEITDEWLRTGKGGKYRGNRVGERQVPDADEEKVSGMELRLMRGHIKTLEAFIKENHPPEVAKALLIKE